MTAYVVAFYLNHHYKDLFTLKRFVLTFNWSDVHVSNQNYRFGLDQTKLILFIYLVPYNVLNHVK